MASRGALPQVFVTRRIPDAGLDMLRGRCEVEVWPGDGPPAREEIMFRVPELDGVLAKRARGFDMRIIYFSRSRNEEAERELGVEYRDSLEAVLLEADFVSLHTPLTPETRHLMNERTLKLMKPTAALINTTRGPVVDTEALYDALKAGTIWAAGLDVTDPEPLPADHKLLSLPNCLVVPHIGSASIASRDAMARLAAENLLAGLEGRALKASPNPEVRRGQRS